jgi:excisionase family DNA binding protein
MSRDKERRGETLSEVAKSFGVSYDTVWRAAKNGSLSTIRLGNRIIVPAAEIERVEREGFELKAS